MIILQKPGQKKPGQKDPEKVTMFIRMARELFK